jgi:hypothetical protein
MHYRAVRENWTPLRVVGDKPLRAPALIGWKLTEEWNEKLRCPGCGKTGMASLSQSNSDNTPTVHSVSDGFKVVQTEYGPDFRCRTCNIAVDP